MDIAFFIVILIFFILAAIYVILYTSRTFTHENSQWSDGEDSNKKRILILSSRGGYCHTAVSRGLSQRLYKDYNVKVINPLHDQLASLDFVYNMSFGKYHGEQMYDALLQKDQINVVNFMVRNITERLINWNNTSIEKIMRNYFKANQPDLVISVAPIFNYPVINSAGQMSIPYVLVTLDNNIDIWSLGFDKLRYDNLTITLLNDHVKNRMQKRLADKCPDRQIELVTTGFPLRADFYEDKDNAKIRKDWDIEEGKPVLMLMMGGAGSNLVFAYCCALAEKLSDKCPFYILVCRGKNKALEEKISQVPCRRHLRKYIKCIPFTRRISDLMSISDLIITKPGGGTTAEALHMKCPILFDSTSKVIFWERDAIHYVQQMHVGHAIYNMSDFDLFMEQFLFNDNYKKNIRKNFDVLQRYEFDRYIDEIIREKI